MSPKAYVASVRCHVVRAPTWPRSIEQRARGSRERWAADCTWATFLTSARTKSLTELFSRAGAVDNVHVMRDQATGRARGFAFVEMATDEDAQKAIDEFHEYQMEGRALVVNEARPKPAGGDFGGGGGGGGGGGYGGGGGGRREPRW